MPNSIGRKAALTEDTSKGQLLNRASQMLLGGGGTDKANDPKLRAREALKLLESIRNQADAEQKARPK